MEHASPSDEMLRELFKNAKTGRCQLFGYRWLIGENAYLLISDNQHMYFLWRIFNWLINLRLKIERMLKKRNAEKEAK